MRAFSQVVRVGLSVVGLVLGYMVFKTKDDDDYETVVESTDNEDEVNNDEQYNNDENDVNQLCQMIDELQCHIEELQNKLDNLYASLKDK